jgi:cobalt-zinc-cadmium efflux system protein
MAHNHSHSHTHHHVASAVNTHRAFALAVGVNLLFTITQASYAFIAHSTSLLADAGHNLGDVAGLAMAWGANWLLQQESSEKYSYGYKKTTVLAALANALLLVLTAALILHEAIYRFLHPVSINAGLVIGVAIAGIIVNGGSALLFIRNQQHDLNIKGAFLHLLADAGISFGVVLAGAIIYYTDWLWVDPVVCTAIVVIILWSTWGLLRNSIDMVLDAVPHNIDLAAVKAYLLGLAGVEAIHDLHIWNLSTHEIALTAHLVIPNAKLADTDYKQINRDLLQRFHIHHVTLQVEQGHVADPCGQAENC